MTNREFIERIALEGEEWRIIDGTLGYFAVSDYGRVSSLSHRVSGGNNNSWMTKPRILTPRPNRGGYLRVRLTSLHGVDKTELVHRLVAKAFIPNPNNYAYVDHIDGNRTNNVAHNLRWCTRSMNMLNPVTRECAAKARRIPNKRNRKPIVQIKNGIFVIPLYKKFHPKRRNSPRHWGGNTYVYRGVCYNVGDFFMPVPQGSTSYEPARHRQYIFTEYEYNDAKEDPKAAHLCLLPPCQSAFHFDNFCIGPVFIDNAVPINHFFFKRHRNILRLVLQRVAQRTVVVYPCIRNS